MKNRVNAWNSAFEKTLNRSLGFALGVIAVAAQAQTTALVSRATGINGALGNGDSPIVGARISGNGQFVAFRSVASNLVPNDTNGYADVFVRDTLTNVTTRVSIATGGIEAIGGDSNNPSISTDGRFVSFSSAAFNLGPSGIGMTQVYLHDRQTGITNLVSVASDGISVADGVSDSSAVWANADGSLVRVAFRSTAANLVGNDNNGISDVFVRDMTAGSTTLISVAINGWSGNGTSGLTQTAISGDGSTVGFMSSASNLVSSDTNGTASDVFTRNLNTNVTTLISRNSSGNQVAAGSASVALSNDGSVVAFQSAGAFVSGDTNGTGDVFVRDTKTGVTSRVSIASGANGTQGNSSSGNSNGWGIAMSADGSKVAFQSLASNLTKKDINGLEDVFLRDRSTNTTSMVSMTPTGGASNGSSGGLNTCGVSISSNGQYVLFSSYASNLVTGDSNGWMDVFRRGVY